MVNCSSCIVRNKFRPFTYFMFEKCIIHLFCFKFQEKNVTILRKKNDCFTNLKILFSISTSTADRPQCLSSYKICPWFAIDIYLNARTIIDIYGEIVNGNNFLTSIKSRWYQVFVRIFILKRALIWSHSASEWRSTCNMLN